MQRHYPFVFIDGFGGLLPHALEELPFLAIPPLILSPLIDLEGKQDAKRHNRKFDRDPSPVALTPARGNAPPPGDFRGIPNGQICCTVLNHAGHLGRKMRYLRTPRNGCQ